MDFRKFPRFFQLWPWPLLWSLEQGTHIFTLEFDRFERNTNWEDLGLWRQRWEISPLRDSTTSRSGIFLLSSCLLDMRLLHELLRYCFSTGQAVWRGCKPRFSIQTIKLILGRSCQLTFTRSSMRNKEGQPGRTVIRQMAMIIRCGVCKYLQHLPWQGF